MNCKDSKIVKINSFLLVISPIANVYASFIPGVGLGELFLVFLTVISFLKKQVLIHGICERILGFYLVYSIIITFLAYIFGYYQLHWFNRLIRYSMYTIAIFIISKSVASKRAFFHYFYVMSVIILFTLLFQYLIFYTRGRYIKLFGNFLTLSDISRLSIDYESIFHNSFFRPSSFFTEPAHLCQYLCIPFTYFLFDDSLNAKKRVIAVLSSGSCIILSTSLYGFGLLFFELLVWYSIHLIKSGKAKWLFVFPFFLAIIALIVSTPVFRNSFLRIDTSNLANSATFTGRFEGYKQILQNSIFRIIFGSGFGNIGASSYSNSIVYIFSGTGIIGCLFWLVLSVCIARGKREFWEKMLYFCFILLLLGSSIILSINYVLIFIAIFSLRNNLKRNKYDTD